MKRNTGVDPRSHRSASSPGSNSVPAGSLPGPDDITRVELSNGIVVLARANFNSPSVFIHGYLPVGSLFEPDEKLGLASFTASALMRGTARRDFQGIYESLESVGAWLGIDGGAHSTGFTGRSLAEDLDMLLELFGETLRQPVFPPEQVERLRAQILTGLAIRAQDTGEMASLAFDQIVYEAHPYRRPEDGFPETVQSMTRQDLEQFHRTHYGPRGMVIVVVGGVEPSEAVEIVSRVLGDWENAQQPLPPDLPAVRPLQGRVRRQIHLVGKSQADLVMGAVGPPRSSPDFLAASLGNSVLGQFGMYGRIGESVRERSGLAYYAYSSLGGGLGPGPWFVSAGVDPANLEKAIDLVLAEITRFVEAGVSDGELEDSQAHYIGRLPLSLESNGGVAGALTNLERHKLGLDYYQRYAGLIAAISVEEVKQAARRYLHPERLAIAAAGSFDASKGGDNK